MPITPDEKKAARSDVVEAMYQACKPPTKSLLSSYHSAMALAYHMEA